MQALSEEPASDVQYFRVCVQADNAEHWAQVREHFRVGPRLPLLALYAQGRWQRSLQGPAPESVVRAFVEGPLSLDAEGNVT